MLTLVTRYLEVETLLKYEINDLFTALNIKSIQNECTTLNDLSRQNIIAIDVGKDSPLN